MFFYFHRKGTKDLYIRININNQKTSYITLKKKNLLFYLKKEYLIKINNIDLLRNYESRQTRKVSKDSTITYSGCKYSVPTIYINKIVEIEFDSKKLSIYYNKKFITCHTISNNIYNYHKEDLIDVMKSDVYKNKSYEELEKIADARLASYDKLGKKGGN